MDCFYPYGVPAPVLWLPSLLSAQEPLLSIIFCLPGLLVSTDPAYQYFNEPCCSLSQNKQNPCLDPPYLYLQAPVLTPMPCPPPDSQTSWKSCLHLGFHSPNSCFSVCSRLLSPLSQGPSEFHATKTKGHFSILILSIRAEHDKPRRRREWTLGRSWSMAARPCLTLSVVCTMGCFLILERSLRLHNILFLVVFNQVQRVWRLRLEIHSKDLFKG